MGSNPQVEFMIGSLPLAVLTQRCARTSELARRREFISSFRLHPSSLQFTLQPLASNDLSSADDETRQDCARRIDENSAKQSMVRTRATPCANSIPA